jgi:tRNA(Ile)-lysidine synthase
MELLLNSLRSFFQTYGLAKTYWIAYSGGLDSRVLLQLCADLRAELPIQLRVVHVNHSLSPYAAEWAAHCSGVCRQLQIDYLQQTIDAKPALGESPEAAARHGRYAVFAELLADNDILLTAHQQDDQAETLLLQLLRGAGPKGLAAMPMIKRLGKGWHARPLLEFTRGELQRYADAKQLQWIDDESNLNTDFTRNFLRHDVLPLLKTRWPTVTKTLTRVADNCAEAEEIIADVAQQDLLAALANDDRYTLSVKKLAIFSPARQRQILRAWFAALKYPLPSAIKLKQIQQDCLREREDKAPHLQWGNVELRRYLDELYVMPYLQPQQRQQVFQWDLMQPLVLPGLGELQVVGQVLQPKPVQVRFRQGGEVCQLPGRAHHHELKKLMQAWQIPPWQRNRIPLIYFEDRLIAVVGYFVDPALILGEKIDFRLIVSSK